jgi:8-amino-7-oxononanoate synthase
MRGLDWIADELDPLAARGLLRRRRTVSRLPDGWCEVDCRRLRDFASNDYLGLAHDPRVIAAARGALEQCGAGAGGSPLVAGRSVWHERLERRLAAFEGCEAAILFPTGYAANLGAVAALAGRGDVVFSDRLNHASLIDACRLSRAAIEIYDPARLGELEAALDRARSARRRLIVSDSLFSMDGAPAPLVELAALAERHDAALVIDEAHATGVFGARGRGVAEHLGVEDRVAVRVGTLSKAVGSSGGFVAGARTLVDWLWNRARTQVFSTAAAPASCAAACAALDIIEHEPQRRERLAQRSRELRRGVEALGLASVPGGVGPIVPVILRDPEAAMTAARRLEEAGFLVGAIRPPSVPPGTSRLRISVMAVHEAEDVARLLDALECATAARAAG